MTTHARARTWDDTHSEAAVGLARSRTRRLRARSLARGTTAPEPAPSPWRHYDTESDAGVRIRVATHRRDAAAVRAVLRAAWGVEGTESYFYGSFDDAAAIYREMMADAAHTDDIRGLSGLCLVAEDTASGRGGCVVATMSLVFDHAQRTVELGRAGTLPEWKGQGVLSAFARPVARLLCRVRSYAVIVDATTLTRSAGAFAEQMGAVPVALHPSAFTVPAGAVASWHSALASRHGDEVAGALLDRSEATGLGRFATAYHLRLPLGQLVYTPHLTPRQRVLYAHTRRALAPGFKGLEQPAIARSSRVVDRPGTATRTVWDPGADACPAQIVADADAAGVETVVVQVLCDRGHAAVSRRLEAAGATLCGVFPDAFGCWRASYVLVTRPAQARRAREALATLCESEVFAPSYQAQAQAVLRAESRPSVEPAERPGATRRAQDWERWVARSQPAADRPTPG